MSVFVSKYIVFCILIEDPEPVAEEKSPEDDIPAKQQEESVDVPKPKGMSL